MWEEYKHIADEILNYLQENNLPIIRVSNSGITAYIDNYGRVIKKIKLHKVGFLDVDI